MAIFSHPRRVGRAALGTRATRKHKQTLAAGATHGPASANQNRGRRSSNAAEASANNQKLLFKPTHTRRPSPTVL